MLAAAMERQLSTSDSQQQQHHHHHQQQQQQHPQYGAVGGGLSRSSSGALANGMHSPSGSNSDASSTHMSLFAGSAFGAAPSGDYSAFGARSSLAGGGLGLLQTLVPAMD
jgi:hypothetical protein